MQNVKVVCDTNVDAIATTASEIASKCTDSKCIGYLKKSESEYCLVSKKSQVTKQNNSSDAFYLNNSQIIHVCFDNWGNHLDCPDLTV